MGGWAEPAHITTGDGVLCKSGFARAMQLCTGYTCHAFFISVLCQFASTVLQNAEFSCFHKCYAYNKKNSYEKTPEEKTKILTTKPITVIWFSFPLWD